MLQKNRPLVTYSLGACLSGAMPWTYTACSSMRLEPEGEPAEAALEDAHAQARIAVHDPAADEGGHEPHPAPGVRGEPAEEDVVPEIPVAREVRRVPGAAVVDRKSVVEGKGGGVGGGAWVKDM